MMDVIESAETITVAVPRGLASGRTETVESDRIEARHCARRLGGLALHLLRSVDESQKMGLVVDALAYAHWSYLDKSGYRS